MSTSTFRVHTWDGAQPPNADTEQSGQCEDVNDFPLGCLVQGATISVLRQLQATFNKDGDTVQFCFSRYRPSANAEWSVWHLTALMCVDRDIEINLD